MMKSLLGRRSRWINNPQIVGHHPLILLARIILDLILFDCPAVSKIAILFNQKSLTDVKTSFSDNVEVFR